MITIIVLLLLSIFFYYSVFREKVERMGAPGESPGNFMDTDRQQVIL